jgi:CRISPR-associated protein Cas2
MRRCYLVAYDVSDPKRWRKIFKAMGGFGEWWQYSTWFCVLRDIDKIRMQRELDEFMNHAEDQIIIIDLGPDESTAREAVTVLGQSLPKSESGIVVI